VLNVDARARHCVVRVRYANETQLSWWAIFRVSLTLFAALNMEQVTKAKFQCFY